MHPYFESKERPVFITHKKESYDFPPHFHTYIEISYCFSGLQKIKVGENTYSLKSGDAIVIFPNTVHEYIKAPNESDTTECISLICDAQILVYIIPEIVNKYAQNPFIPSHLISGDAVTAFGKMLTAERDAELIGWTYITLSNLIGALNLIESNSDCELPSKITTYIEQNFKKPLTIKYIAKELGYHPSYIAHIFCNRLQIPFRTYLGNVRSEYVASKIRTTDKTLTEIAYDAGFCSLNSFCRCFKKHFSQTPSQYKKKFKKQHPES